MSDLQKSPSHALAAAIIGASLIVGTLVVSAAVYKVKALNKNLSVTGSAERIIRSDTVKWKAHVTRSVMGDGLAAGSRSLRQDLNSALEHLAQNGIADKEVNAASMEVTPTCGGQNQYYGSQDCGPNPIIGYTLTQSFTVESPDVDKITDVSRNAATALLEKGIVFSSDSIDYYYSKLTDLKLDMLSEATRDAKARAGRIAAATGAKLGSVQSASMGVFQITAVNSTEISDYGAYDTSTIDKKVTAVVRAAFALP